MLKHLLVFLCISGLFATQCTSVGRCNNACKHFKNYFYAQTSKNCFYNPDMHLDTPELIEKYAGTVETYKFTTQDGYILTMFRIPRRGNSKGTILLQHPLTVDSRVWVALGNESLALSLWAAGYDVWLNNNRGTLHSQGHKHLKISDQSYWNFSFHEFGVFEIPSELKIINKVTHEKNITFIGYSMGSTSGLIYASLYPDEAKKYIKTFIFMATPCYFKYATSVLTYISKILQLVSQRIIFAVMKVGSPIPVWPLTQIVGVLTRSIPMVLWIINLIVCSATGWIPEETDPAILNFDSGIYIKRFSWKILIHYAQLINRGDEFRMFDYGKSGNLQLYKSEVPPMYPIENISVPLFLISGMNDSLTTSQDSDLLLERLSDNVKIYGHEKFLKINHVGLYIGKQRLKILSRILTFLKRISK